MRFIVAGALRDRLDAVILRMGEVAALLRHPDGRIALRIAEEERRTRRRRTRELPQCAR